MDDAAIRKRCEEWASKQGLMEYDFVGNGGWEHTGALVELVKAAFTDGQRDGMERAAKDAEQMRVQACSIRNETSIAFELLQKIAVRIQRIVELEKKIRQAAGEVQ